MREEQKLIESVNPRAVRAIGCFQRMLRHRLRGLQAHRLDAKDKSLSPRSRSGA